MILSGYCSVQEKQYSIFVTSIPVSAFEDTGVQPFRIGQIGCEYANRTGKCNGSQCSILIEHGLKR